MNVTGHWTFVSSRSRTDVGVAVKSLIELNWINKFNWFEMRNEGNPFWQRWLKEVGSMCTHLLSRVAVGWRTIRRRCSKHRRIRSADRIHSANDFDDTHFDFPLIGEQVSGSLLRATISPFVRIIPAKRSSTAAPSVCRKRRKCCDPVIC